jgi:Family of unknown function (DUF6263)
VRPNPAAVALVLLCVSAVAADAQTVTLRYQWAKGQSRTYRVTNQTDSAITGMPSGPMNVSQTMTQLLKYTAEDVGADGSVTLRQTFQSVRMESSGPMGRIVIDSAGAGTSDNPTAQSVRQIMTAMIGESVLIEMAPDGALRKVDGASRIADKISRAIAAADPAAGAAGQGLRSQLSDDALKNTLEQTFPKLSAPPIKPDGTWIGAFAMGNPVIGRISGRSTFTLKAVEGTADAPLARIAVILALKQDAIPPPSGPTGMVMTLGDAKGVGEILFNVPLGQIQRSTMRSDLPSTLTMNGPDGSPTTMGNKTTTTMTMELVDK